MDYNQLIFQANASSYKLKTRIKNCKIPKDKSMKEFNYI